MTKIHQSQFIHLVKERWPELTKDINAERDLLHFQVKHIRNLVQSFINSRYEQDLVEAFSFLEHVYLNGNSDVRNAIDVSIVEELEFADRGKLSRMWAWSYVPPKLKELYTAFHGKIDA